jgi:hypothetical protein
MKRILSTLAALSFSVAQAQAAAGFSCQTLENEMPKFVVEGATPRSGGGLINFGAVLEIDGKKIEFKQSDVQRYFGEGGVIRVRVRKRADGETYTVSVNAKRNPKDEDDWGGTYEITLGVADKKSKAAPAKRGKVQCFVE